MSLRLSRRWVSIIAPIALFGCSVIAKSEAPQCANDNDCFVKFGGGFACQAGGCVSATSAASTSPVVSTLKDCRATQECVAALGEGFLCRRDRDDPQKKGVCQQLTPSSDCTILGDYKNDQVVLLGALLPGRASPAFAAAVQRGLERAVDDWSGVERQLQTQTTGADTVAPPRPFAFIACSEDVPEADLRNIYLNSGTRLVVGPAVMNAQTELLTTELTNAKIVFVSPTTFAAPAQGANVGTYFFRLAGNEAALGNVLKDVAPKPTALFRQTTSYVGLATALTTAIPGLTPVTYDDPNAFTFSGDPNSSVAVLGDGETVTVLTKAAIKGTSYVLPSATPDIAAALGAGSTLPTLKSAKAARSTTVPSPAFAAGAFGDAEMYDAVYLALAALAAVDPAVSPEDTKDEVLQAALLRASAPAGKEIAAQSSAIKDLLTTLRASTDATVHLSGATGSLAITDQATTRNLVVCTVDATEGCK